MMRAIQTRATLQREIARHLEQEIADEEDAGAGAEHRGAEPEIIVHR
jgi:hypothetical protein